MANIWQIIVYGTLAGLATIAGLYLIVAKEKWARKNSIYLISFSAGVLLAVALGHLLPEAESLNPKSLLWLLGSFIAFYVIEHGIILHSCNEDGKCEVHPIDTIALIGMGLHSLLDGIIIGVGFEISLSLGIIATSSVLLHKIPDGISMASILLHSNYKKSRTVLYTWVVAALTPLGAISSYLIIKDIKQSVLGLIIAIAAGSFLYVAAADLIPEIHRKSKMLNIILVVLGVLLPFFVDFLLKK